VTGQAFTHLAIIKMKINNESEMVSPSKQVKAVGDWWTKLLAASPEHKSLEETRDFISDWQTLTAEPGDVDYIETVAGGIQAMWAAPKRASHDSVLLCFHGGGFFTGSMYTHRKLFAHFAKAIGCRALILNYRLAPEFQFPAQVNDALSAYAWLINEEKISPKNIAFTGDSAGGNLAITAMLLARDKGLPLPAAAMPFCAYFDMEVGGESMMLNKGKDLLFTKESVIEITQMYLGEKGSPKDKYANPLYADLSDLPSVYLQVGADELLLNDSTRLAEQAKKTGVDIKIDIFPHMQHTWHMAAGRAPESNDAIKRYAAWVKPKLGL
jgi:monoterpene epsilon-lactone hydrolase